MYVFLFYSFFFFGLFGFFWLLFFLYFLFFLSILLLICGILIRVIFRDLCWSNLHKKSFTINSLFTIFTKLKWECTNYVNKYITWTILYFLGLKNFNFWLLLSLVLFSILCFLLFWLSNLLFMFLLILVSLFLSFTFFPHLIIN